MKSEQHFPSRTLRIIFLLAGLFAVPAGSTRSI